MPIDGVCTSGAQRVEFVLCESSCVGQCLADVILFEVRQVLDDLRRRHAIRNEVDHVSDGNAKAADRGSSAQYIRRLRDAIECARHSSPRAHCSAIGSRGIRSVFSLLTCISMR
jgi:hypothetical protein